MNLTTAEWVGVGVGSALGLSAANAFVAKKVGEKASTGALFGVVYTLISLPKCLSPLVRNFASGKRRRNRLFLSHHQVPSLSILHSRSNNRMR